MAEPSGIALTFMDEDMRDRIRLDSIMCVVDAEQIFAAPEMMELKLRQVAFADMLILNKVDLVTPEEIEQIKAWLDDRFYRYRLVQATRGEVPLEILLSVGRFDAARLDAPPPSAEFGHPPDCDDALCRHHHHGHRTDHSQVFRTWSYETEAPLSMKALGSRKPAPGQHLQMQRRGPNFGSARPTGHPSGRWQTSRYCARRRMEWQRSPDSDSRHRCTRWREWGFASRSL